MAHLQGHVTFKLDCNLNVLSNSQSSHLTYVSRAKLHLIWTFSFTIKKFASLVSIVVIIHVMK